ncbi:DUF4157 domain-containing protein [Acaryochloris sp. IP29b_bin.137]|uniref:eCIS core domain-containing protein n=1 Tax=Acaryochloris sp. IP29b_bin.137 TaxID=2969217 RepID=UPI00260BB8C1|nr:DUF4157 domain-containing protein [Acaryochloris sp. IP29b_bin.137]
MHTHQPKLKQSKIQPILAPSVPSAQSIPQSQPLTPQSDVEGLAEHAARLVKFRRIGSNMPPMAPPRPILHHPIQPKLTIGEPGDKYEQEADRVAKQVVNQLHASPSPILNAAPFIQRQTPLNKHEIKRKSAIQRVHDDRDVAPHIEASIHQVRGKGQPLEKDIRTPMELAFGASFDRVRIHTDNRAHQLNELIQARAFTTGQDLFFRQGAYQPHSHSGQELLAHELTHVLQQSGSGVKLHRQIDVLDNPGISELNSQSIQRDDEEKEEDLTLEEEQEWLQAKLQRSHSAVTHQHQPTIQRQPLITIQRAWTGRRQLSGLGGLGKPWVWRKKGNLLNLGLYHEHIFFEDGGTPADIGHMGKAGLGSDTSHTQSDYARVREGLDDDNMRAAVAHIGNPGEYGLLSNNCQDYVQSVLDHYDTL